MPSAVSAGAAGHLVELHLVERQMVQRHVADVGYVDALAEGRGGHEHQQVVVAEHGLDAGALGAGEVGVVEADHEREARHASAQMAREGHGLLP